MTKQIQMFEFFNDKTGGARGLVTLSPCPLVSSSRLVAVVVVVVGLAMQADAGRGTEGPVGGEKAYELVAHGDSAYAHELFRLGQVDLMKLEQGKATGAVADLWKAELIMARWEELTKDRANVPGVTEEYLAALRAYVKSQDKGLDGAWALDHGQFILGKLAQPIITQLEYFGSSRRDRAALAPLAAVADEMLQIAERSLDAAMKQTEAAKPFDEKAYSRSFAAATEVRYYGAWEVYFRAMAMDVADANGQRKKLLMQAAEALGEWAVDNADNGVNFQAYLLRAKALSEAGEVEKAVADFAKAQNEKAPNWVQYQARYQTVVANLRGRDLTAAQRNFDDFLKWIPKTNTDAQISAEMLRFRVAWAAAEGRGDPVEKRREQRNALDAMAALMTRDQRYRDLVFEQIALAIPENADINVLLPLQQLALAHTASVNQKGDTPESRGQLERAVAAASAAQNNAQATKAQQAEATLLLGVSHALLGNLAEAVKWEVAFAGMVPQDPRARQMVDLALEQIGALRAKAAATATFTGTAGAATAGGLSPELVALALKALDLSANTFGDRQWLYAQGRLLEESGKVAEAAAVYEKIPADERTYLEARYRLVALATEKYSGLEGKAGEQAKAASELFAACVKFTDVLANPPANTPKEVVEAAKAYQYNIWLLEAATAVTPAVKNPQVALDRLAKLDAAKDKLTAAQKAAVLQYRVQAYLLTGQQEQASAALEEFLKVGEGGLGAVRGMALAAVDEIDKSTDSQQIKKLSGFVVMLLEPLVKQAQAEGKSDNAFEYQLIQADMMAKAGQFKEAGALAVKLQEQKPEDLRGYLAEARALFGQAQATVPADAKQYAKVQDYFTRILGKLSAGSETFWESWLRVVQSMEAQAGANARQEIKSRLGDLKAVYGVKFGGEKLGGEFRKLAEKYEVP